MNDIEKIDNVSWYGHCVIHFLTALKDLPEDARIELCQGLLKFIRRQERLLRESA